MCASEGSILLYLLVYKMSKIVKDDDDKDDNHHHHHDQMTVDLHFVICYMVMRLEIPKSVNIISISEY